MSNILNTSSYKYKYKYHQLTPNLLIKSRVLTQLSEILIPMFLTFCSIFLLINAIILLCSEKESGIQHILSLFNISENFNKNTWIITLIITSIPIPIPFIIVIYALKIVEFTNPIYLILLLYTYLFAIFTFSYFISSIIINKSNAACLGCIVSFGSLLLFIIAYLETFLYMKFIKYLLIFPILPFSFAIYNISYWEIYYIGLYSGNFNSPISQDFNLSFLNYYLILLADGVFYFLLGLTINYSKQIYKVGIKDYFTRFYKKPLADEYLSMDDFEMDNFSINSFEQEPYVEIKSLSKTYTGNKVKSLEDFNLKLYKNEIIALLGQNGAGKSTLFSILVGKIEADKGTVYIDGVDMKYYSVKDIGFCPQENILYENLSIKDHYHFYSKLYEIPNKVILEKMENFFTVLNLMNKLSSNVSTLSYGMKRKLSIAISFIGDKKFIILDEPTAGLDPISRRDVWDLINNFKKNKTVLFSTHFLDEASILGHKVAIINEGKLYTFGTPNDLKLQYGKGNKLIINFDPVKTLTKPINMKLMLEKFSEIIPNITVDRIFLNEISLIYHIESLEVLNLIKYIENNKEEFNISSYGFQGTSLTDVFLTLGKEHGLLENSHSQLPTIELHNKQSCTILKQFLCLMYIKWLNLIRNKSYIVISIIFPSIFLLLSLLFFYISGAVIKETEFVLSPRVLTNSNKQYFVTSLIGNESDTIIDFMHKRYLDIPISDIFNDFPVVDNKMVHTNKRKIFNGNELPKPYTMKKKFDNFYLQHIQNRTIQEYFVYSESFYQQNIHFEMQIDTNSTKKLKMFYHMNSIHSSPIMLNILNNEILNFNLNVEKDIQINAKINKYESNYFLKDILKLKQHFFIVLNLYFILAGLLTMTCSFGTVVVKYYKTGFFNQITIHNVPSYMYYFSIFVFDMIHFSIITIIFFLASYLLNIEFLTKDGFFVAAFLMIMSYGICQTLFNYLLSKLFNDWTKAFNIIFAIQLLSCLVSDSIFDILTAYNINEKYTSIIYFILKLNPSHRINDWLYNTNDIYNKLKAKNMIFNIKGPLVYPYKLDTYYESLLIFYIESVIIIFVLLFGKQIHHKIIKKMLNRIFYKKITLNVQTETSEEDDDSLYNLRVNNLHKMYGNFNKTFHAVKGISFKIQKSECFALLGVNGAGKSSTFNILTGINCQDKGSYELGIGNTKNFGFCPQYDAINDLLTPIEHLLIFNLFFGYELEISKRVSKYLIEEFNLSGYKDTLSWKMSLGNKRKLSSALCLIGDPDIIFMDEPTSGMDPISKIFLWNEILKMKSRGKSIMITTHNLEECEALCDTVAIMSKGEILCIGSSNELKEKYSKYIELSMTINDNSDDFISEIMQTFPEIKLHKCYKNNFIFFLPRINISMGDLYKYVLLKKHEYQLTDITINQASLEQVFIDISNEKIEEI